LPAQESAKDNRNSESTAMRSAARRGAFGLSFAKRLPVLAARRYKGYPLVFGDTPQGHFS
jgi:hypothetical protein